MKRREQQGNKRQNKDRIKNWLQNIKSIESHYSCSRITHLSCSPDPATNLGAHHKPNIPSSYLRGSLQDSIDPELDKNAKFVR